MYTNFYSSSRVPSPQNFSSLRSSLLQQNVVDVKFQERFIANIEKDEKVKEEIFKSFKDKNLKPVNSSPYATAIRVEKVEAISKQEPTLSCCYDVLDSDSSKQTGF